MILERFLHLLGGVLAAGLIRGLAVFAVAYAVTAVLKGLSPESRHLIWFVVIASFLLLPLAWMALPAIRIGPQIPVEPVSAFRVAAAPVLSRPEYVRLVYKGIEYATLARPDRPALTGSLQLLLPLVWLAGVGVLSARWFAGHHRLKRLAAAGRKTRSLQSLADTLALELGAAGKVKVSCSPRCSIPFTFGLRRPVILLPDAAASWPESRLRSVLTHELAHIRRRDVLLQSIAYAVCVMFWFIPLLWIAYGFLLREAETCCDQQVINRGIRGPEYAREIIDLVRSSQGHILLPIISTAIGRKSMLKERIRKVLSLRPARLAGRARGAARVLAVFLCCLAPLLVVTCATRPSAVKQDEPLFGTWVNAEYEGNMYFSAKCVIFADGRELDYDRMSSPEPEHEFRFTIEEKWIDAEGNHWYKTHGTSDFYPYKNARLEFYFLTKINSSGTVLESVGSMVDYPEEMSLIGGAYSIYYKQE